MQFLFTLKLPSSPRLFASYPALYTGLLEAVTGPEAVADESSPAGASVAERLRGAGVCGPMLSFLGPGALEGVGGEGVGKGFRGVGGERAWRAWREQVRFACPAVARSDWLELCRRLPMRPGLAASFVRFICQPGGAACRGSNPLLTFIEGGLVCRPTPALPLELLKHMAFKHGSWHQAAAALSRQISGGLPHRCRAIEVGFH